MRPVHAMAERGRALALALLVVCAALPLAARPALADPVTLTARANPDFGRLTFTWPQPVGHQATRTGNQLVVMFSRPIQADLRPALKDLGGYIASIEPAPNEATVVFRLKGDFAVRSYDSGKSVVVDIVGAPQGGQPQAQTQAQPQPQQAQPQQAQPQQAQPQQAQPQQSQKAQTNVPVRVGTHPDYARVVFDWPGNTAYSLARDGGQAILTFDAPANIDVRELGGGRTKNIQSAKASNQNGKLVVSLGVDPTSRINAFQSGAKVVVDVYAPGTQAAARPAQPDQASQAQGAATQKPADAAPLALAPATSAPPPPTDAPAPVASGKAPVALTPPGQEQPVQDAKPAASAKAAPSAGQSNIAVIGSEQQGQAKIVAVKIDKPSPDATEVRFEWDEPVGAALFRRGDYLWVTFDKRAKIDTQALVRGASGVILSAEQVPSSDGTALRFATAEGFNPDIKRAGYAWLFQFVKQPLGPLSALQADAQPDSPLGARLFVAVPEPGNPVAFRDPDVGDNLVVVPVIPLGHGVARPWSYPQVKILPSKQGLVIKPVSDDVRVRPIRQGVEMTSTGTLQISSVSQEEKANINLQTALASSAGMDGFRTMTRVLDLEKWKRPDLQDFIKTRQSLQRTIAFAKDPPEKERARRELLKFYVTNGFEAEALGVLETMLADRPGIEKEPDFLMLRGAASWLMGRIEDARANFFNPLLDGTDEAVFWRAAVVASEGDMKTAAYDLRRNGQITAPYPYAMKLPTATLVAEAAVELGDFKQAGQYLEVLSVENPTEAQRNQIAYVSGRLKELSGDPDGAVADWESAMAGVHRPSRAKAAVARTELLLKMGRFSPLDAIEEFEKLRFVWRGDDFEFALLRRLGGLYLDEGKFREGLGTLRQAVTYFPDHAGSNQITKLMSDTFLNLYMNNGADALAPVTAIALYDEFRELTPPGSQGDEMYRKLADRMVGVDLLDRAADLLEQQVDFRLKDVEKARVGARLALVYLFDRKYEHAIRALDKTDTAGLGDELKLNRLLLRARAHIGLEQPDVALDLVRPEIGIEAERIRAEIYWRAKDWANAARALGNVVRLMDARPRKPLDDRQALAVLSWTVAETLEPNEAGVSRIVASYANAMAQTAFADAFTLVSSGPEKGMLDVRALGEVVKLAENFQGFMEIYRQRLADGQLSALF